MLPLKLLKWKQKLSKKVNSMYYYYNLLNKYLHPLEQMYNLKISTQAHFKSYFCINFQHILENAIGEVLIFPNYARKLFKPTRHLPCRFTNLSLCFPDWLTFLSFEKNKQHQLQIFKTIQSKNAIKKSTKNTW